jgi:hypothetical protein
MGRLDVIRRGMRYGTIAFVAMGTFVGLALVLAVLSIAGVFATTAHAPPGQILSVPTSDLQPPGVSITSPPAPTTPELCDAAGHPTAKGPYLCAYGPVAPEKLISPPKEQSEQPEQP